MRKSLRYCLTSAFLGGQNFDQRVFVELVERRDDREPPDELGDESVAHQVLGLELLE